MESHHGHHHFMKSEGLSSLEGYLSRLDPTGWAIILAVSLCALLGLGLAYSSARRCSSGRLACAVTLFWSTVLAAYAGAAEVGSHELFYLFQITRVFASAATALAGLGVLLNLTRLELTRPQVTALVLGLIALGLGWFSLQADPEVATAYKTVRELLKWAVPVTGLLVCGGVALHILQGDYSPEAQGDVPRKGLVLARRTAFVLGSLVAVPTVYVGQDIVRGIMNDPHSALHRAILRAERELNKYLKAKAELAEYLEQDEVELQRLKAKGVSGLRVRELERSVAGYKRSLSEIQAVIPKIQDALWLARRLEMLSHRLESEKVGEAARVLGAVLDAEMADRHSVDVGLERLEEIVKGTERPRTAG